MEHPPPVKSGRLPWKAAGLALLPAAAGLLLIGVRPHAPRQPPPAPAQADPPPAPEPQFFASATPPGHPSLRNLHFRPLNFGGFPALASDLRVAYRDGAVSITEDQPDAKTVWSGPVAGAVFVQEAEAGVHTLKDSSGKVLWSDAADVSHPDLLLVKTPDGKARLSGEGGETLWTGLLPPMSQGGGRQSRGEQISIVTPDIRVDGAGGIFRVTAGKLLWMGRLRRSPMLITRSGGTSSVYGPNRASGGGDRTRHVSMEAEKETVTIADTKGRTLGTRTVKALAIRREVAGVTYPGGLGVPVDHRAQEGELDVVGTLLLTYRDSTGRVLRRVTLYKDAHGGAGRTG